MSSLVSCFLTLRLHLSYCDFDSRPLVLVSLFVSPYIHIHIKILLLLLYTLFHGTDKTGSGLSFGQIVFQYQWHNRDLFVCLFGHFTDRDTVHEPVSTAPSDLQGVGWKNFPDSDAKTSRRSPDPPPPPPHSPWKDMMLRFLRQKSEYRRQNSNIWCQNVALIQISRTTFKLDKKFVPLKTSHFVRKKLLTPPHHSFFFSLVAHRC